MSFSEDDCTSSRGWPPGVQPTSERAASAVLYTKRREEPELLRTPLHDAALLCGRIV